MSPPSDAELARVAARLGDLLRERAWRLATAESSTGGLIGHAITMTPGASDYYVGGVICYSNLAKELLLGVPHDLIEAHGAVSHEVAAALAEGAAHRFGTEVGMSVTGIAGPDGGQPGKPVGTVWFGWAWRAGVEIETRVALETFGGDREAVRRQTVARALGELLRM